MLSTIAAVALLAAAPDPAAAERVVQDARRDYRRGELQTALPLFEKAIADGASGGRLFYETGRCLKEVRGKDEATAMMQRAIPVLESAIDATPPPSGPEPFYYLASIYIQETGDAQKGVPLAQQAVKLFEEGSFQQLAGADEQFQMGRLYEMAGRKDEAVPFYEKAIAAYDKSKDPDRDNLLTALEQTAFARASKKEWASSADLYERVLGMTTLPERDRFSAGVVMLRADRFDEAEKALEGFTDDSLATEANYILSIIEKYRDLGSPPLPAEPETKDDAWLQESIMQAAADLGKLRSQEAQEQERLREEWLKEKREEDRKAAAAKSKRAKYNPPPKPKAYVYDGPLVPQSEERQAAERRFFSLMAEYIRRGNLVRNFALSAGLAQLIFR